MKILAPAKINLCLDILRKTPSGYHEIRTVFQEIPSLADELEIIETQKEDDMSIRHALINQEENLAFKALKLLKSTYKIQKNAKIIIQKKIPISSGLGGASSDAAAVLKGLNKLWNLGLSQKDLLKLAEKLGKDVPFFIIGGTALGTNFGEKLTPLSLITCIKFEITPRKTWPKLPKNIDSSKKTGQMYESLDLSVCGQNLQKTTALLKAIENQDKNLIIQNLHNDFETLIRPPKNTHLSGSGPATFTTYL